FTPFLLIRSPMGRIARRGRFRHSLSRNQGDQATTTPGVRRSHAAKEAMRTIACRFSARPAFSFLSAPALATNDERPTTNDQRSPPRNAAPLRSSSVVCRSSLVVPHWSAADGAPLTKKEASQGGILHLAVVSYIVAAAWMACTGAVCRER